MSKNSLEYGVALLMNLCLRTNGRKKCAEIAEQAITTLSTLLAHPDHEVYLCLHTKTHFYCFLYVYIQVRPYINSSLYSILTLKSIRDKAIELVSKYFFIFRLHIYIFLIAYRSLIIVFELLFELKKTIRKPKVN